MRARDFNQRMLYCILDLPCLRKNPLSIAQELISGGADIIQLRAKSYSAKDIVEIGLKLVGLTRKSRRLLIINDRVDIAKAVDADGVHLGQRDLPVIFARQILGRKKIIGLSAHSLAQVRDAQNYDLNYISVGPIFKSPTKPHLSPLGLDILNRTAKISKLPIVAIGGIDLRVLKPVLASGITSVAVVSALLRANDIKQKTREFKKTISGFRN